MYTNVHPSEMLDRNIHATVLEWVQHLSAHRAVVFSKSKAAPTEGSKDSTYMRPVFARRVDFEYMERSKANDSASAIDRLRIFK